MVETTETPESITAALTAVMAEAETETEEATDSVPEGAVTETEEVETSEEVEATEVEEDDDESGEPEKVFAAPEHWSSDQREKFEPLSSEAREIVLGFDAEFKRGYQEKAQTITAITEAIKPWEDALARRGITADQAIRTLFAAQNQLETNALQGVLQIAQGYGIVDQLKQYFAPQTDDDEFTDPGFKALQQEIKGLKGDIQQTNQGIQQQTIDAGNTQIESFKSATDDDGKLKHPHFEQVMNLVTSYVRDGETLDSAYEKAVWTIPEFRTAQVKMDTDKADAEKALKAKKAKKAARGVRTNGKADVDEGKEAKTLHDDLKEAWRQHS